MTIPATALPVQIRPFAELRNPPAPAEAARDFEAAFLSVMLKAAGFGAPRESFGGGIGEEQISGLLCDEQARAVVAAGGLGLTDQLLASGRFGVVDDA